MMDESADTEIVDQVSTPDTNKDVINQDDAQLPDVTNQNNNDKPDAIDLTDDGEESTPTSSKQTTPSKDPDASTEVVTPKTTPDVGQDDTPTTSSTPATPGGDGVKKQRGRKRVSGPLITGEESVKKREVIEPRWLRPFQHGWKREIVFRNTYQEKKTRPADVYYYAPTGAKVRSGPEIQRKLTETNSDLTIDCFTFVKEPIHDPPMEVVRFAGKGWGRPAKEGSPSKTLQSPKTPKSSIMKKKQSPFVKSPLSLKKAAIATALPTSPKSAGTPVTKLSPRILLKPGGKQSIVSLSSITVPVGSSIGIKPHADSFVNTTSPDGKPLIIKLSRPDPAFKLSRPEPIFKLSGTEPVIPKTVSTLLAVAKKHTGPIKRPRTPVEGDSLVNIAKKYKPDDLTPKPSMSSQRLCGMDCPGRQGIPPSLHCNVCMCMFHPECVGKAGYQRLDGFVCKSCKLMNKKLGNQTAVSLSLPPPPLQMTTAPSPSLPARPPPLRPAPNLLPAGPLRAPPPLRMAPGSGVAPVPLAPPPPLVIRGSSIMTLGTATNNYVSNAQPLSIVPNVNIVSQTASNFLPSIQSIINPVPAVPAPISITMPITVPKDINGQILALPNNVTNRLNLAKPISLKVNGQRFVIPPNCFVNTSEGAKVYLPQGYLPGNMTQGTTSPLSVNLNKSNDADGQVIDVTSYNDKVTEKATENGENSGQNKSSQSGQPRRSKRKFKGVECYIQPLHVGFDCMLHIFQYLNLEDLLRASQVCKTWKRVAEQHCLWRRVELRGCRIGNWEKAALRLRQMNTQTLDLRGLQHADDPNRTWHQLTGVLRHLVHLRHIDFGQCPGSMLHAVTDKLKDLEGMTAEFITDTMQEPEMWTTNVKLDIGKFAGLEHLEILKLRGVCGLLMPAFSFSGGLTELSSLSQLRTLSLTTLRDAQEEDFSFLPSLVHLQELELGDISDWKPETYSQLSKLTELRSVRLECGVDSEEGGLGEAVLTLNNLKNLELIKFATSSGLVKNLHKVKSLNSFSIWPDTEKQAAHVNTYTLRAVSQMTSLTQLDWGIMIDQSTTNSPDEAQDSNGSSGDGKPKDGIPILPDNFDLDQTDKTAEDIEAACEYVTVQQIVNKIGDFLPDTKIRVFQVPIISASKS